MQIANVLAAFSFAFRAPKMRGSFSRKSPASSESLSENCNNGNFFEMSISMSSEGIENKMVPLYEEHKEIVMDQLYFCSGSDNSEIFMVYPWKLLVDVQAQIGHLMQT